MDGNFKKEVIDRSLEDIKVELDGEFDKNFTRKAFFDEKQWPDRKYDDGAGSLLERSGGLRRSIHSRKAGSKLIYGSAKPYARIHNEGGEIKVTRKMKGYFFHRLKEAQGGYTYKKDGSKRDDKHNRELTGEEAFYKAMALKKEGSAIKIPERRFIGNGKTTDRIIHEVARENIEDYFNNHKIIKR